MKMQQNLKYGFGLIAVYLLVANAARLREGDELGRERHLDHHEDPPGPMTSQTPNAVVRPVVEHLPDPRGAAMFAALNGAHYDGLHGAPAVIQTHPEYRGWVRTQQQFAGAVAFLGRARTIAPRQSTLNEQKTSDDTVAASIFRERMVRGLG